MISEGYTGTATPEEVADNADKLWAALKKADPKTDDELNAFNASARSQYENLFTSYPLVCNYMIYMRLYRRSVFLAWLKSLDVRRWRENALYIEDNAEYITSLKMGYKRTVKRLKYKKGIIEILTNELEQFQKTVKEAEKKYEEEQVKIKHALRSELAQWAETVDHDSVSAREPVPEIPGTVISNQGTGAADDLLKSLDLC